MNPVLQFFYCLWHTPGKVMTSDWWDSAELSQWRLSYEYNPLTRPALDLLLRKRLGLEGIPPALTPLATELLCDAARRQTLLLALGLWAMEGKSLLLLKPYRDTLSDYLDSLTLGQLQLLLPYRGFQPVFPPEALPKIALEQGAAWLADVPDPAIRACRLLFSPSATAAPDSCLLPVLQKLVRWL